MVFFLGGGEEFLRKVRTQTSFFNEQTCFCFVLSNGVSRTLEMHVCCFAWIRVLYMCLEGPQRTQHPTTLTEKVCPLSEGFSAYTTERFAGLSAGARRTTSFLLRHLVGFYLFWHTVEITHFDWCIQQKFCLWIKNPERLKAPQCDGVRLSARKDSRIDECQLYDSIDQSATPKVSVRIDTSSSSPFSWHQVEFIASNMLFPVVLNRINWQIWVFFSRDT